MNERIRELAEQAERLVKDELAHLERVHNRLYSFTEGREIYNQKFAELIVRECAEVQMKRSCDRHGYDKYEDAQAIKEHFGVAE